MIIESHCHTSDRLYEPVEVVLQQMERNGIAGAAFVQYSVMYDNSYQAECVLRDSPAVSPQSLSSTQPPRPPLPDCQGWLRGELPPSGSSLGFAFIKPIRPHPKAANMAFGAKRLMWGSDYPPVSGREGYARSLKLPMAELQRAGAPAEETRLMFGGNAARPCALHSPEESLESARRIVKS